MQKNTANALRRTVLSMIHRAGSGHSGGSLSCAEILTVLYDDILRGGPGDPLRDRFILSKGHAAPALYATLARKGIIDPALLDTLRQFGSPLQGHPCMNVLRGVEMSTGSLGLGISVGVGMALASGGQFDVWVLCGDGEMQEGSNWEGLMSASKWKLNLHIVIDYNEVQLDGTVDEIMPIGNLSDKLTAFGIQNRTCDGHDCDALREAFEWSRAACAPTAVIAKTVKGKGISFMEGRSAWHGKQISDSDYAQCMIELDVLEGML